MENKKTKILLVLLVSWCILNTMALSYYQKVNNERAIENYTLHAEKDILLNKIVELELKQNEFIGKSLGSIMNKIDKIKAVPII